jgi:hypothetical protein
LLSQGFYRHRKLFLRFFVRELMIDCAFFLIKEERFWQGGCLLSLIVLVIV